MRLYDQKQGKALTIRTCHITQDWDSNPFSACWHKSLHWLLYLDEIFLPRNNPQYTSSTASQVNGVNSSHKTNEILYG